MSKKLKLVKRIAAVATTVCVVAGMMVSASAYGITVPAEGRFVYDGSESSVTVPVTGTSTSGQVTIVIRRDNDNWLTDPNNNVVFIDQVTGAEGATSITFGIDNKWLPTNETYKIFVGGSSQAVTTADIFIGGEEPPPPAKTLVSIAVSGQKTTYTEGDAFVAPTVTATYSDNSTEVVTATFSGYDMNAVGTQTVTVKYEDKETTYSITVNKKIEVQPGEATLVAKLSNNFGDATKAVVEAKIADNGAKKVMVGDAELYYNETRGVYVGIIAASDLSGTTINNVSILDEAPTKFVYGNVNNDAKGTINNGDLLQLKLYMQSKTTFEAVQLISADVNGDGRINNGDLLQLKLFMQKGQQFGALGK